MINKTDYLCLTGKELDAWLEQQFRLWSNNHKLLYKRAGEFTNGKIYDPISSYAGFNYRTFNEALRSSSDLSERHERLYRELTLSILSAPVIKDKIIVYRWTTRNIIKSIMCKTHQGICFYERGFMSTTFDPSIINHCEGLSDDMILMRLFVDEGAFAVYVPYVAGRNEKELLFLPGCELRYIGRSHINDVYPGGNNKHI